MRAVRQIPGYAGYAATDEGLILSYWRREWLGRNGSRSVIGETPYPLRAFDRKLVNGKPSGYVSVNVKHADGRVRNRYVHELVLFAFTGPRPSDIHEALHGDDNRSNNRPGNLRWGTTQENADDRERAGHVLRGDAWYRARGLPPPWLRAEIEREAGEVISELGLTPSREDGADLVGAFDGLGLNGAP